MSSLMVNLELRFNEMSVIAGSVFVVVKFIKGYKGRKVNSINTEQNCVKYTAVTLLS